MISSRILVLFAGLLFATSCFAAEPRFRIALTLRHTASNGEKQNADEIIGSPILVIENGKTGTAEVGAMLVRVLATYESNDAVRLALTILQDGRPLSMPTILDPLGKQTSVRVGDFQVDVTPTLEFGDGIDVEFDAGTLGQLIQKLRTDKRSPLNVVSDGTLNMNAPVPGFAVRNANSKDLAAALNTLLASQGVSVTALSTTDAKSGYAPIILIRPGTGTAEPTEFACWDLSPYLSTSGASKHYTVDGIVKILNEACEFRRGKGVPDDLRVRFHEESKLLFISGSPETVRTATATLAALPKPTALW